MRKVFSLVLILLLSIALTACQDKKYFDDSINVIFFTANEGASQVQPYLMVEPGQKIEQPEDPTREGFLFDGWFKDFFRTEPFDFENDTVGTTSMILYANWIPMIFNIYYELSGGTMPNDDYKTTFVPGENYILPVPRRTGYNFRAWYTYPWVDPSSTRPGDPGYQILPKNHIGDLYLYAHWAPVFINITFRSNYPLPTGGPANPSSMTLPYGSIINFPVLEDTADYVFLGWNSSAAGTGTWYINGEILIRTQRITLYAIWQAKN